MLAGTPLPAMQTDVSNGENDSVAIGSNLIAQLQILVLDCNNMTFEVDAGSVTDRVAIVSAAASQKN